MSKKKKERDIDFILTESIRKLRKDIAQMYRDYPEKTERFRYIESVFQNAFDYRECIVDEEGDKN